MLPEFDLAAKKEAAHYKEVSTRSRFLQQIFLGIGGATVFGFIGVITRELLGPASAALGAGQILSAPILGLLGIAAVGIGCLYIGAKYLSNTVMLEQDYSAKRIAMAANVNMRLPQLAPTIDVQHTQPVSMAPVSVSVEEQQAAPANLPEPVVHDVSTHQRLADGVPQVQRA